MMYDRMVSLKKLDKSTMFSPRLNVGTNCNQRKAGNALQASAAHKMQVYNNLLETLMMGAS